MTVPLDQISRSIFEKTSKLSVTEAAKLTEVIACGNTLIELMGHLLKQSSVDQTSILDSVLDEVFVDLHVSVTLAMGSQYKSACVLLRACLEVSLYLLYFFDHPVEAHMWADATETSDVMDMSFSQTLEKVASPLYAKAASGREPNDTKLKTVKGKLQAKYRLLSQRVHGKYAFLQSTTTSISKPLDDFSELALETVQSLVNLGAMLSKEPIEQIKKKTPALEKYL